MKLFSRILVSIVAGDLLFGVILVVAVRFTWPILLWNLRVFSFVGRGEPVGYMPDGAPIYDGGVGFLGLAWANILLGFVIYPVIVFVLIAVFKLLKNRNN